MFLSFDKNTINFYGPAVAESSSALLGGSENEKVGCLFNEKEIPMVIGKASKSLCGLLGIEVGGEPIVYGDSLRAVLVPSQYCAQPAPTAQRAPAETECLGAGACRKCHHSCCCTEQVFQENQYQENQLPCLEPYHYDGFFFIIIFSLSV